MKIDEAFDGINRLWQEISVIVVLHALALVLAIYAHLIPMRTISQGIGVLSSLPELANIRANLQRVGLDLPFVVGIGIAVYVVLFQRFSVAAVNIPMFRLSYSQPALWRAGKCFDELRLLVHFFEGYTASTELPDLEVTLGLATAQYAKDYKEHHRQLVDARLEAAAIWARYYSGFCLLAFAAIVFLVADHPTKGGWLLPIGLLVAALVARCGWEIQIEYAVIGRLHFANDCAIISGVNKKDEPANKLSESDGEGAHLRRISAWKQAEGIAQDDKGSKLEIELAAGLLQLPPPWLPYQNLWGLHYVRQFKPFKRAGALPLLPNQFFRDWFMFNYPNTVGRLSYEYSTDIEKMLEIPEQVPDDRFIVRLLRGHACFAIARWLAPRVLLVDEPSRYRTGPSDEYRSGAESSARSADPRSGPLRKWVARRRIKGDQSNES